MMRTADERARILRTAIEDNAADLLAYLLRRTSNHEDAADLLAETAETAWKRIAIMPTDPVRGRMWLFVTARHKLANHQRKKVGQDRLTTVLADDLRQNGQQLPMPSDDQIDVQRAVRSLPAKLREVIELVHWDGFTVTEAARVLRLPTSTARTRYAAAIVLLRQTLCDHDTEQLPDLAASR
ncbi:MULTISPECIES: RNA polymerase sigma factor [unclassified Rathayibacter]|uniref:RNA polymerase sigma factor n=1 Tax=unclassified Rathayibacter TaxID=2609250 RepID=UPI001C62D2B6|nr:MULTISPECIES: RNA polymerase sigma factor [unclassified Rathayibacter]